MIAKKNLPAVLLNMFVLLLLLIPFGDVQSYVKAESAAEKAAITLHSGSREAENIFELKGSIQPIIRSDKTNAGPIRNFHSTSDCLLHPFSWSSVYLTKYFFSCFSFNGKHGKKNSSLYLLNRCLII